MEQWCEPAKSVINKFGGSKIVASACKRDVTSVNRWRVTREKGGTGGLIPSQCQPLLLQFAKENQIEFKPSEFFESATQET